MPVESARQSTVRSARWQQHEFYEWSGQSSRVLLAEGNPVLLVQLDVAALALLVADICPGRIDSCTIGNRHELLNLNTKGQQGHHAHFH